ncbi:MAG: hypothetical protein COW84_00635 [Gammaproteobacteria bacterium CG22_combo_CG10-13_8_21_14_all_40_8]|nr:MAG: hypothetical protein COW84_00635 [Gammaproteobacteria bacterium CG22_combo_CG10-13_8_21_14_all_40_8]
MSQIEQKYLHSLSHNLKRALGQKDCSSAQLALLQLQQVTPLALETRGFELELLIQMQQWPEALNLAEQLGQLFPHSPKIHFLSGKLYYSLKNYKSASAAFKESQKIYPSCSTQRWLGKSLTQQGLFDEAESWLQPLKNRSHAVLLDLSWLYERKQNYDLALQLVDKYLQSDNNNPFAVAQQLRLRSLVGDEQVLMGEVNALLTLGENIPEALIPQYIHNLFSTGKSAQVRQFIQENSPQFSADLSCKIGWVSYKFQAYDLVNNLFLAVLAEHVREVKFLSTLESAAKHCCQVPRLIEQYEVLAHQYKPLHGRIVRLKKWCELN